MPQFIDYDTVNDKIYYLGNNTYLCFTVKLSKKDKDGNRIHYHQEYEYKSSFIDKSKGYSIKRNFDFYLTIENKQLDIYIQIRMENMFRLNSVLENIVNVLMNDNLWAIRSKRLIYKGQFEPLLISLPMDKWITLEPSVIQYDNGQYSKAVKIVLSQYDIFIELDIEKFMGLVYLLSTFNMYQCALSIVNYLNWNQYGTNLVSFNYDKNETGKTGGVNAPKGRTVQSNTKSFFDT